jgi:hypothetical protein
VKSFSELPRRLKIALRRKLELFSVKWVRSDLEMFLHSNFVLRQNGPNLFKNSRMSQILFSPPILPEFLPIWPKFNSWLEEMCKKAELRQIILLLKQRAFTIEFTQRSYLQK